LGLRSLLLSANIRRLFVFLPLEGAHHPQNRMKNETPRVVNPAQENVSSLRAGAELFLISLIILFLELACIRWFAAHVIFLTFFTNTVLLACFLGMSVGCLASSRRWRFLNWTPAILALTMGGAHLVEQLRESVQKIVAVGNQASPQLVYFGTEYITPDPAGFFIPVEALGGVFFLAIALAMVGPGQELGRAFTRVPNRISAYSLNILGSLVGIVLFAACSWWEVAPFWWFTLLAIGLGYFLWTRSGAHGTLLRWPLRLALSLPLLAVLDSAFVTSGLHKFQSEPVEQLWSPYYRIDYDRLRRSIMVNLISHQDMVARGNDASPSYAYTLPHILNRDAGGRAFEDVLIIGAGSGNDVSRALQWDARHIDAVEIDPVILRLGRIHHPDHPYQDGRVSMHLDDGRNFLRSTQQQYDLIVYALLDSLVLHSSYSNIRLESYLFTQQAFADIRRCLRPGGQFFVYNYFRQGWIVARLFKGLTETFGREPLVVTLPARKVVEPQSRGGFTVLIAGDTDRLRRAFARQPEYWLRDSVAPGPTSPNGFQQHFGPDEQAHWKLFLLAKVGQAENLRTASDDWPFLYLRRPMLPLLSLRGMGIMGGLALLLLFFFLPRRSGGIGRFRFDPRMFFLGAGFMLVETKAVVHMALLFGSTWMVNSLVFFAVLAMILAANLFVLRFRPERLGVYYAGLFFTLALNILIPLDFFLGMNRALQVAASCFLVFAPILFAGVVFAVSFGRSAEPDRDFGANTAGAMLGGLAEYSSMLLGFQYLMLVAVAFYVLSAVLHRPPASGYQFPG
jgi:SAM-dependent methyltransferase